MDLASIIGLASGVFVVLITMLLAGSLLMFWDTTSMFIVLLGSAASTLVRWPIASFIGGLKASADAIQDKNDDPNALIDDIVNMADTARKQSIIALEKVHVNNAFLAKGGRYMADGHDIDSITSIMSLEIAAQVQRNKDAKGIFQNMGEASPAFGMIGTVIGLIVIMANLDDPKAIGPGLAVALVTTLYGTLFANVFFIPLSQKISYRGSEKIRNMRLIVEGVKGILGGDNPKIIRERLSSFLEESSGEEGA